MEQEGANRRTAAIWSLPDSQGRGGVDEALRRVRDITGKITLQDPWNGYMSGMAAILGENKLHELAGKLNAGKALTRSERNTLRTFRLNDKKLLQLETFRRQYGKKQNGLQLLDTRSMRRSGDQRAIDFAVDYETSVSAFAHGSVPKPGVGSFPRFFDNGDLGAILGMFRRFGFNSAQEVLLVGLQRGDAQIASGLMAMIAFGGIVELLKTALRASESGQKSVSEAIAEKLANPGKFMLDSIDRSGATGIFFDIHNMSQRLLGVGLHDFAGGNGPSRYVGRNLFSTLSPLAGYLEDLVQVAGSAARLDITDNTVKSMRDLAPWQSLFYVKWLTDKIENRALEAVE